MPHPAPSRRRSGALINALNADRNTVVWALGDAFRAHLVEGVLWAAE